MNFINHTGEKLSVVLKARAGSTDYPKKIFLGILLLGLLARIYISFFTPLPNIHTDSQSYFEQAAALLNGGYTNFFPNGYPFIIALVKLVSGSAAITVLLWLNIVMSALNIYFSWDISRKVLKRETIALLAAFTVAFFPSQINYVRWLMTEVPSCFFVLGAWFFYYNQRHWLCGLFLGMATLVRTEMLPIFFLLFLFDGFYLKRFNWRMVAGVLLPLLLLGSYCYMKTGEFSLAGHSRFNILTSVTASGNNIDFHYADNHPEYNTSAKATKLYIDTFKNDPIGYVKHRLANLWELWGFYAASTPTGRMVITRIIIGLGNLFLIAFGLLAWWKNRKEYNVRILIIPFVVITAVHIVYFAMQRYTYPVEPFMIILASCSIHSFLKKSGLKNIEQ